VTLAPTRTGDRIRWAVDREAVWSFDMPVAAVVSFRLGGPDGVSVQAATWGRALERLGFAVRRVAGELADGPRAGDVVVPGLAVAAEEAPGPDGQRPATIAPDPAELAAALAGADVVVVENLLSLPLNLAAARVLTAVLSELIGAGVRVVLHHHDLAWQRPELARLGELPPLLPGAVHVAINDFSRRELRERGIEAVTVRNAFDLDAVPGRREETRAALGLGDGDVLVLQPTRAIARKNIPAALRLSEGLAERLGRVVRYWLPGPAEDGYGPVLDRVLAATRLPVVRRQPGELRLAGRPGSMADAYAACDLVVFPSTEGEGFGQPVIESVWARRPLAVARYQALDEILAFGFSFLPVDDPQVVADALCRPDPAVAERNLALAQAHFSLPALVERLSDLVGVPMPAGAGRAGGGGRQGNGRAGA
jgi:glycosyltransferase involved in cell wall biosynthesis